MTTVTPNKDLFAKVLEHIELGEAGGFDQGSWRSVVMTTDLHGNPLSYPTEVSDARNRFEGAPVEEVLERCETHMCTAGWAVELDPRTQWALDWKTSALLSMDRSGLNYSQIDNLPGRSEVLVSDQDLVNRLEGHHDDRKLADGTLVTTYQAERVARHLLGITARQAGYLFSGDREDDELKAFIRLVLTDQELPEDSDDLHDLINEMIVNG